MQLLDIIDPLGDLTGHDDLLLGNYRLTWKVRATGSNPHSRHNGEDSGRETRTGLGFGPGHHDKGTGLGNFVQVGQNLDLVLILFENPGLHAVIVLGDPQPAIGVSGLVTCSGDFTLIVKIFQDFLAPGRVVKDALVICVHHLFLRRPAFRPVGPHGHKAALRYGTILGLPGLDIPHGDGVVGVDLDLLVAVDDNKGQEHFLARNILKRP